MSDFWDDVLDAVESGDDQGKKELLARADELVAIVEKVGGEKFYICSETAIWNEPDEALLKELSCWVFHLTEDCEEWQENRRKFPPWVFDWYKQETAWEFRFEPYRGPYLPNST